jgi:hypothetical protein
MYDKPVLSAKRSRLEDTHARITIVIECQPRVLRVGDATESKSGVSLTTVTVFGYNGIIDWHISSLCQLVPGTTPRPNFESI